MTGYNPWKAAFEAATNALTNSEAQAFYRATAVSHTAATMDAVFTLTEAAIEAEARFYEVSNYVFNLGFMFAEFLYDAAAQVQATEDDVTPVLPAPVAIAALPPAVEVPRRHNTVAEISNPVLVTPSEVVEDIKALLRGPAAPVVETNYLKLTKAELMDRCAQRGLDINKSMTKAKLARLLTESYGPVKPHQVKSGKRLINIA